MPPRARRVVLRAAARRVRRRLSGRNGRRAVEPGLAGARHQRHVSRAARVLAREAVAAESIPGGFGIVYPVLKGMEETGRIRRGYFVAGLGATQFAMPGALDLLRSLRDARDEVEVAVLAATDPANPYGATVKWPRRRSTQNPRSSQSSPSTTKRDSAHSAASASSALELADTAHAPTRSV